MARLPGEPRIDHWVAHIIAKLLVFLARRAAKRGDGHELEHIRWQIKVGNSAPCWRNGKCRLGELIKTEEVT